MKQALAKREGGFTLIELIAVTVLLALLGSIVYKTLDGLMQSKQIIEDQRSARVGIRYVLSRMMKELSSRQAYSIGNFLFGEGNEKSTSRYSNRVYFLSKNETDGNSDKDSLRFISGAPVDSPSTPYGRNGVVEITYRLERMEIPFGKERPNDGFGSYILVREEIPSGLPDKDVRDERKVVWPIAENVIGLNFRFRKRDKWLEEWKMNDRGFPEAVEITLKFRGARGRIETFRTAVAIEKRRRGNASAMDFYRDMQ